MRVKLLGLFFGLLLGLSIGFTGSAQRVSEEPGSDEELALPPGGNPAGVKQARRGQPKEDQGSGGGKTLREERRQMMRERYLERIKKEDPKRYQRIERIKELAQEYRNTEDPAKKEKIEKELRELLNTELRAQQEDAKKRIEEMEKKLERMKKMLKQREEHWKEVVDYNFKKLTGEFDYLEFPPVPPEPMGPPEP